LVAATPRSAQSTPPECPTNEFNSEIIAGRQIAPRYEVAKIFRVRRRYNTGVALSFANLSIKNT